MAQSNITAGTTYSKLASEVCGVAVSFVGKLRQGEVITGTPTVTAASGPTFSTPVVNTGPIQILGETCPAGTAVTFTITGGTAAVDYLMTVTVTTSSGQTRALICPLSVASS